MWVRRMVATYCVSSANPDPDDDPEANASSGVAHLNSKSPFKKECYGYNQKVEYCHVPYQGGQDIVPQKAYR